MAGQAMIQLFHVMKRYANEAPALVDVSLDIEKGEFVFLTGSSGAGKSTLLKLMFCAEAASEGQLLVFGRNVSKIRASSIPFIRRNIGVIFQDFKLLADRTVAENVAFPLEVRGLPTKEIKRKVAAILGSVGLEHKMEKFPLALSGGEQQRVAVARALVNDPGILLADEPTGNLDAEKTLEVMDLIHRANARGTTVVVATHDRGLLERYKRRVVVINEGRVVSDEGGEPRRAPPATAAG